ncbi:diacylglyceryl transferase [Ichthyenterobacterium sp. W332]|uniref:Diacylglyceryl transferase n=1 Tax=Microcosmobacter mediterraneus TaxID=3075607 RepID=A0ABU2YMZ0_9FLAO|nr:DUF6787 family protein [Ichthyenterobacterium sp. W332]MDT0559534.1 diacylglyceryl transferase [Ichthyenterobacterium sp. W332]
MEKLKKRWGISSNLQVILILIVFAVTGSSSIYVTKPILNFFGIVKTNFDYTAFYYFLKILLVFPVYQVLLVFFGWIFGQFNFFWNFEKKMLSRLGFKRWLK